MSELPARSLKSRVLAALVRLPALGAGAEARYLARRERVYRVEAIPGVFFEHGVPASNHVWEERLSRVGGHERGVCEWLRDHLRDDDVVYDIGSHYGYYPSLIATLRPSVSVHAFEPEIPPRLYLRSNRRRLAPRTPWHIVDKFIGAHSDRRSVSLDDYARRSGQAPSIVKIDIEGAEVFALAGARELIARRQTEFLVELHQEQIRAFGSSIERLLALFPDDFLFRALPELRSDEGGEWSEDLRLLESDGHPYLYAGAPESGRLTAQSC